jgi:hypothetical protein
MQESTEPSLTKPVASEAQCDSANRAHSESRNSAPQSVVPTNFVEISLIPKVDSPGKEQEGEEETEVETDDKASSPGEEHMTGRVHPMGRSRGPRRRKPYLVKELSQQRGKLSAVARFLSLAT